MIFILCICGKFFNFLLCCLIFFLHPKVEWKWYFKCIIIEIYFSAHSWVALPLFFLFIWKKHLTRKRQKNSTIFCSISLHYVPYFYVHEHYTAHDDGSSGFYWWVKVLYWKTISIFLVGALWKIKMEFLQFLKKNWLLFLVLMGILEKFVDYFKLGVKIIFFSDRIRYYFLQLGVVKFLGHAGSRDKLNFE